MSRNKLQPDLDVDAQLRALMAEKDGKLPKPTMVEGFDPVILRGKDAPDYGYDRMEDKHPLLWEQPKGWWVD